MTPEQHKILALEMRMLAQKTLLDWLADILRLRFEFQPPKERSAAMLEMTLKLSNVRQSYATMTLPNLNPAESDMRTALFQEPFDELSVALLRRIDGSGPPKS